MQSSRFVVRLLNRSVLSEGPLAASSPAQVVEHTLDVGFGAQLAGRTLRQRPTTVHECRLTSVTLQISSFNEPAVHS